MNAPLPSSAFVSYAQNGEDVLLFHALRDVVDGFYVDVGANDPDVHSVTRAFYERGWSGVNVEPLADCCARLRAARPRDVTLELAAGAEDGFVEFYELAASGLSTVDAVMAQRHVGAGQQLTSRSVPVRRLASIVAEHGRAEIHFLKIDVEGAEAAVLAGADLATHRPWIVVIESTEPLSTRPTHAAWEPTLLRAGYEFVHFDGLNRYYVAAEAGHVAARLREAVDVRPPFLRSVEMEALRSAPPEAQLDFSRATFLPRDRAEPTLRAPTSQLCTRAQFDEPDYVRWCTAFGEPLMLHRKQWEFVYLLRVLECAGMLAPGKRGLGFGCGAEPLAAVMAARGCEVVATDLPATDAAAAGWASSNQHASTLEALNARGLCDPALFAERVTFRPQDMNAISGELRGFDFVWSSCAFEHLGSIAHGLAFVSNVMACLKPGGLAVHTTEFNLTSDMDTIEERNLVFFRRRDIERVARSLSARGHSVLPLNFHPGSAPLDRVVDLPPYRQEPHLRMSLLRYATTSLGIAVRRGA